MILVKYYKNYGGSIMRINEERIYKMYLNCEEFGLLYSITNTIPYGYYFDGNDESGEFIVTVSGEYNLDKIKDMLEHEMYYQLNEECNRYRYEEIRDLLYDINTELE
jgi:hypothetical protein